MNDTGTAAGIGLGGAMFLAFLVLKLCKVIHWSWWWVAAPLWIPLGVILLVVIVFLGFALLAKVVE